MKRRSIAKYALLCALALACHSAPAAAQEVRLGDYIYVPAMSVAASGTIALRVEGMALSETDDQPQEAGPLAGAQFGVYVVSGDGELTPWANPLYPSEPMRIRTGEGETSFTLPAGTEFYLRQESAPQGYVFNPEELIPVAGGEIVVRNRMAGELLIRCVDSTGAPLSGITLEAAADDGTTHILTTDERGEARILSEQAQGYTIMESALPEGVFAARAVQGGEPLPEGVAASMGVYAQAELASRTRVTFEHPASGSVQLAMTLAGHDDFGEAVLAPLPGVRMDIAQAGAQIASIVTGESGVAQASLLEGEYDVSFRYEGGEGVNLPIAQGRMLVQSGATTLIELSAVPDTGRVRVTADGAQGGGVTLAAESGQVYGPYAFDAEGMAVSGPLPAGEYHIEELIMPDHASFGALTVGDQRFGAPQDARLTVEKGGLCEAELAVLTRRQQTFALLIRGIDEEGGEQLRPMDEPVSLTLAGVDGQAAAQIDAAGGEAQIDALSGRYTLALGGQDAARLGVMAVSEAFDLPSAQEAIVFASDRSRLVLFACDEAGAALSGAVYSVTDAAGHVHEVVCDADGMAVTPELEPGYALVSTLIAPKDHAAAGEIQVLAEAGEAVRVQMAHAAHGVARIAVRMQRLGEQGQALVEPLPGVHVDLYRVAQDGAQMTDTGIELPADGQGMVTAVLEPGEYVARMDGQDLPAGCREAQALRFEIDDGQSVEGELLCMDALGGVRVRLTGGELTDEELAQVRFELHDAQGGAVSLAPAEGGFYAGGLAAGAYVLRQTQMPAGYALARERTVTVSGGEVTLMETPLEEYAVLSAMKTGLTFDDALRTYVVPLTGAYGVYTMQDGEMKPYPDGGEQAVVWANVTAEQMASGMPGSVKLPADIGGTTYYLQEIRSGADGFAADEAYHEVVLFAGERKTMTFAVSSDRGFFTLEQTDAQTGAHVPGGAYALVDAAGGETVLEFAVGDEPYRNPMAIPVGEYRLRQVEAAEGYALDGRDELVTVRPYLTQGGEVASIARSAVRIPQDGALSVIRDVYTASEQGLTLLCVDSGALPMGETLAAPVMELRAAAQGTERTNIASLVLSGVTDAQGGEYMARVEYELAGGGWQPGDARMTGVISGPTAVSFADIADDIRAVRVTYIHAQTGREEAGPGFTPGQLSLSVQGSAQGALHMQSDVSFSGTFVYRTHEGERESRMARSQRVEHAFSMEAAGPFAHVNAGRDGRISGAAFFDEDADGVMDAGETGRYAGMTVTLLTAAGDAVSSVRTDAGGRYAFDSLPGGAYRVQFDAGEQVVFSSGGLYSDHVISGVRDTRYGLSDELIIDGDHTDYVVQAGCIFAAELAGVVLERTGAQQTEGYAGLTVEMRAAGAQGDEEPMLVMTGETGEFAFARVLPGEYSVRIELPQGFLCAGAQGGAIEKRFTLAAGEAMAFEPIEIQREAAVSGAVRIDDDGDGLIADGALGLGGVRVALLRAKDGNTETIAETTTDADGAYAFDRLPLGEYSVLFELGGDWAFTRYGGDSAVYGAVAQSGSTKSFALTPGEAKTGVDAGVTIPAQMSVSVFRDTQYDGRKGTYEEMLEGVTISLIRLENGEDAEEITYRTGADGTIAFAGVSPGEYVIAYQMPGQWRATKQTDAGQTDYPVSAVPQTTSAEGRSEPFTLSMGQSGARMYIGAMLSGSISGTVYYDDDADARRGESELPAEGVICELIAADDTVLAGMSSRQDGSYAFEGLAPGRYRVRFTAPEGCGFSGTERTAARGGVLASDENVSMTRAITVSGGAAEASADAGVVRLGSIAGYIFEDSSADRAKDAGEHALGGLTVSLMDGAGRTIIADTVTDGEGRYAFPALRPGSYKLRIDAPEGYVFSGGVSGGALGIESERSGRGYSETFMLLGGAHVQDAGFGLLTQGAISGMLWDDADYDGAMGGQESGLRGATVVLIGADGEEAGRMQSMRTGEFAFEKLMPGEYALHVTLPEGYAFTADGGESIAPHAAKSDAVIPLGGLSMGGAIAELRIGALKTASVSGTVWYDQDDDGRRQPADAGVPGAVARLTMESGADAGLVYEQAIGADGAYRFDGVMPGMAKLSFTLPKGHAFARSISGTRRVSVVPKENALTAETPAFAIAAGSAITDQDAGAVGVGVVSGAIWADSAYDGRRSGEESGVAGALIELMDSAGGQIAGSATTDENGEYAIGFARVGEYALRVTLPEGMIFTMGGESAIADIDERTAQTQPFSLAMGESRANLDAGAIIPAAIRGRIVVDENADGAGDAHEKGYAGAVVTAMQGGTAAATVRTDENGEYTLDALRPGSYRLRVALGEDGMFAPGAPVSLTHPDAMEGESAAFALAMAQEMTAEPVPVVYAAQIGGRAWMDTDVSGTIGEAEPAMAGVRAELLDAGGRVIAAMDTDASGGYAFTRLRAGSYALRFTMAEGVLFTRQTGEAGGSCVPVVPGNAGSTAVFALAMGESRTDMHAGGILPGAIGDTVWLDSDGNGLQDYKEPLLPGVEIILLAAHEEGGRTEIARTQSDRYGYYRFEALRPGSYVLRVEAREGDTLTFHFGEPLGEIDSDIDPQTLESGVIELKSGQTLRNADVGFTEIQTR